MNQALLVLGSFVFGVIAISLVCWYFCYKSHILVNWHNKRNIKKQEGKDIDTSNSYGDVAKRTTLEKANRELNKAPPKI